MADEFQHIDSPRSSISSLNDNISIGSVNDRLSERYIDENVASCFVNILTVANYRTLTPENIITLGLLFENLPGNLIDERLSLSVQNFREKLVKLKFDKALDNNKLLDMTTECLCFNFKIWSRASRVVPKIGHIQYLTTLIKQDDLDLHNGLYVEEIIHEKKSLMQSYGISFWLRILKFYCGGKNISHEDARDLRRSVVKIISFYVSQICKSNNNTFTDSSDSNDPNAKANKINQLNQIKAIINFLATSCQVSLYTDMHNNEIDPSSYVFYDICKLCKNLIQKTPKTLAIFVENFHLLIGVLYNQILIFSRSHLTDNLYQAFKNHHEILGIRRQGSELESMETSTTSIEPTSGRATPIARSNCATPLLISQEDQYQKYSEQLNVLPILELIEIILHKNTKNENNPLSNLNFRELYHRKTRFTSQNLKDFYAQLIGGFTREISEISSSYPIMLPDSIIDHLAEQIIEFELGHQSILSVLALLSESENSEIRKRVLDKIMLRCLMNSDFLIKQNSLELILTLIQVGINQSNQLISEKILPIFESLLQVDYIAKCLSCASLDQVEMQVKKLEMHRILSLNSEFGSSRNTSRNISKFEESNPASRHMSKLESVDEERPVFMHKQKSRNLSRNTNDTQHDHEVIRNLTCDSDIEEEDEPEYAFTRHRDSNASTENVFVQPSNSRILSKQRFNSNLEAIQDKSSADPSESEKSKNPSTPLPGSQQEHLINKLQEITTKRSLMQQDSLQTVVPGELQQQPSVEKSIAEKHTAENSDLLYHILLSCIKFVTIQVEKYKNYSQELYQAIDIILSISSEAIRYKKTSENSNLPEDLFDSMIKFLEMINAFNCQNMNDSDHESENENEDSVGNSDSTHSYVMVESDQMAKRAYGFLINAFYKDSVFSLAVCRLHHYIVQKEYPKHFVASCLNYFLKDNSLSNDSDKVTYIATVIKELLSSNLTNAMFLEEVMPTLLENKAWQKISNTDQTKSDLTLFNQRMLNENLHDEVLHGRDRLRGESLVLFQRKIKSPLTEALEKERLDNNRYFSQLSNQDNSRKRQWRAQKKFLFGPRGLWNKNSPSSNKENFNGEIIQHWKIGWVETRDRMRLKLTPNYNFNNHIEASRLRDNLSINPDSEHERCMSATQEDVSLALSKAKKYILEESNKPADDQNEGDIEIGDSNWQNKARFTMKTELVSLTESTVGRIEITDQNLLFFDESNQSKNNLKWSLNQLRELHLRRRNLMPIALEFFWLDHTSHLFTFDNKEDRLKVHKKIQNSPNCINLLYKGTLQPHKILAQSGLTDQWIKREISNFEYIMGLNTISGRTYNDLSQYPVFPWIISDYIRKTIDLEDETMYRDLSKPIGIINEKNLGKIRDTFECSSENCDEIHGTFHYGTHYSSPGAVMSYLVRLEPFTSLHIELQSGKFDVADRLFHSLMATWNTLLDGQGDVRELIPEFFYLPEFLQNNEKFDLGTLQDGNKVNDVILPPWASSPEDFIFKHRQALESEYVSKNLHNWVDLIFGYKQRGQAAIEAMNLFSNLSYEGHVDPMKIKDEMKRRAIMDAVANFGQTPTQLLNSPHPQRLTLEQIAAANAVMSPLTFNNYENVVQLVEILPEKHPREPLVMLEVPPEQFERNGILKSGISETLLSMTKSGLLGINHWRYDKNKPLISQGKIQMTSETGEAQTQEQWRLPFIFNRDPNWASSGPQVRFKSGVPTNKTLCISSNGQTLYTGGHWDSSVRATSLYKKQIISRVIGHIDIVTCISLDPVGIYLASASRDGTCCIWNLDLDTGDGDIKSQPVHVLHGHDKEISDISVSSELDMIVTTSLDCTANIYTLRKGHYVRTIKLEGVIHRVVLSEQGHTVFLHEGLVEIPTFKSISFDSMSNVSTSILINQSTSRQNSVNSLSAAAAHFSTSLTKNHSQNSINTERSAYFLSTYNINGRKLSQVELTGKVDTIRTIGMKLITAESLDNNILTIRNCVNLEICNTFPLATEITCVTLAGPFILAGLANGRMCVITSIGDFRQI